MATPKKTVCFQSFDNRITMSKVMGFPYSSYELRTSGQADDPAVHIGRSGLSGHQACDGHPFRAAARGPLQVWWTTITRPGVTRAVGGWRGEAGEGKHD